MPRHRRWLAQLGILVAPGEFYGPRGAQHVRIALTATDDRSPRPSGVFTVPPHTAVAQNTRHPFHRLSVSLCSVFACLIQPWCGGWFRFTWCLAPFASAAFGCLDVLRIYDRPAYYSVSPD